MFNSLFEFDFKSMIYCFMSAFIFCFICLKYFIILLKKYHKFQPIRVEGPEGHLITKSKTPTMGGVVIVTSILLNMLFFCDLTSYYIHSAFILIIGFSVIGFLDDVFKVFFNNTNGFQGSKKLILQLLIASGSILYLVYKNATYLDSGIMMPILKMNIYFGTLLPIILVILITGSSNATNITDGLDGLLSMPVIIISTAFLLIIYLISRGYNFSSIQIEYEVLKNLSFILFSIIGAFSAFLFYNFNPAKIFMGDVASLPIGALLCYISILLKIEMLYGIMAFLFVFEIFSSTLQVFYFKLTHGKRIFKMAPFHHHLEKCGWGEIKIVFSMWLFCLLCCLIGLALFIF